MVPEAGEDLPGALEVAVVRFPPLLLAERVPGRGGDAAGHQPIVVRHGDDDISLHRFPVRQKDHRAGVRVARVPRAEERAPPGAVGGMERHPAPGIGPGQRSHPGDECLALD
ncbi:hypothetical protein GCM10027445_68750 [Amycolatopsis endophytica]